MEREFERSDKKQLEQFGQPTSKEEYIEKSMKDWPGGIAMCIQHVAGALLCLPLLVRHDVFIFMYAILFW